MRLYVLPIVAVAVTAVALGLSDRSEDRVEQSSPVVDLSDASSAAAPLPLAGVNQLQFVPNRGQWASASSDDLVRFAVLGDTTGWLTDDGYTLRLERWSPENLHEPQRRCSGAIVRTRFVNAQTTGFVTGGEFATRHNFLNGDHQTCDVPSFDSVTMRRVLPGIDVLFRALPGNANVAGPFEYDLLLAPFAELSSFAAECEGVEHLRIDAEGRLVALIKTPEGDRELLQQAPIAWQVTDRGKQAIEVSFRLLGAKRYGFVATALDATLATVVDPGVVWGTFLGGGSTDRIHDTKYVPGAGVWVGGWTGSTDFPSTVGAFQSTGVADGFVAKLRDDGQSLVFATYLGGSNSDQVRGIAVASDQTATVVGFTNSPDFPITAGAAQSVYAGGSVFLDVGDAFVSRISANGSNLLASTFAGGIFDDIAEDVELDATGNAIVVGWTTSADFPVPAGGFQPALGGLPIAQSDGFVLGVSQTGQSFSFGTFLGGQFGEQLLGVDRDPVSGDLAVAGWSLGADYPTTPSVVRPSSSGDIDCVLTRLNSNASVAVFSTYMGGIGEDAAQAVAFDADGSVWIGGFTDSTNYPATLTAPQQSLGGANDGFVSRISSAGQSLVFSTLLGGPGQDRVRDIDLAAPGLFIVGEAGPGFPVTVDAVQMQFSSGIIDGFATYLTNNGSTIAWSSYFGGVFQDSLQAVDFNDNGIAVIAGYSYSSDFPIAPAGYQSQLLGVEDGVVLQLDMLTDIGPAMRVDPISSAKIELVESGEVELLEFDLTNISDRTLAVDSVRVLVSGAGATPANVTGLRVVRAEQNGTAAHLVGGPVMASPGTETFVALSGVTLPGQSSTRFVVMATVASSNASYEVAAAIVDASAWQLHALGLGGGPTVSVSGLGRAIGSVCVLGAIVGDIDGSGTRDVVDVRRLANQVGTANLTADTDGDGVLTPIDVAATAQAVLGRATVFLVPNQIARNNWLLVRGLLPSSASVQAVLGGRSLLIGRSMPRELSVRVDDDHPVGLQELVITLNGQAVFNGLVEVL
ncbi:MAG: hypothetical protein ACI9S9_001293 [Planctomycetota bacterium]|jgi:hypothetical protein